MSAHPSTDRTDGLLLVTQAAVKQHLSAGSSIINIGSVVSENKRSALAQLAHPLP